ncbi:hypothetical protein F4781DRAFT_379932 [Annulohypoxylon bovei var. microspora]|nr:hypothetical protein F4781DRAFT_379932 [Annulohypoxylon bovei var. microspora]
MKEADYQRGTGSPRPSPRRWLQSKVASAEVRKRVEALIPCGKNPFALAYCSYYRAYLFQKEPKQMEVHSTQTRGLDGRS